MQWRIFTPISMLFCFQTSLCETGRIGNMSARTMKSESYTVG